MKSKLIIILGSIFWPLGLLLTNNSKELLIIFLPTILIIASYLLYKNKNLLFFLPLLFIPFINTKLYIFPFFISIWFLLTSKTKINVKIFFLLISLLTFTLNFKVFIQRSIFVLEYEKKQEILREIKLYPNPFIARVFQNKARIVADKFSINLTSLFDPGNYFFSFHPRESVVNNQNLVKYPFLAIIPIFVGILNFKKTKHYKFILLIFLSGVISLSLLETFDRSDFILWFPLTLIFINGINIILKYKKCFFIYTFLIAFITNCFIEIVRMHFLY